MNESSNTMRYERFLALLRQHLVYVSDTESIEIDDDLASLGLDSMAAIDLLLDLESEFGLRIPDDYLVPETFATPRKLWNTIQALCP